MGGIFRIFDSGENLNEILNIVTIAQQKLNNLNGIVAKPITLEVNNQHHIYMPPNSLQISSARSMYNASLSSAEEHGPSLVIFKHIYDVYRQYSDKEIPLGHILLREHLFYPDEELPQGLIYLYLSLYDLNKEENIRFGPEKQKQEMMRFLQETLPHNLLATRAYNPNRENPSIFYRNVRLFTFATILSGRIHGEVPIILKTSDGKYSLYTY